MKQNKKAQIELQFKWIFVLIAGGLILFFFFSVIGGQKDASETKLHTDLTNQFELIFAGQGVATGTKNQIDIPPLPLQFGCNDYAIGNQARTFGNAIIFAPAIINTNKMLTLTRAWQVPFKVTNMIYVSAPNIKYYFVNFNDELQPVINDSLLLGMDSEFVTTDEYTDLVYEKNPQVKFIFNGLPPAGFPETFIGLRGDQVRGLQLDKVIQSPDEFDGRVAFTFLRKQNLDAGWENDEEGAQGTYPSLKFETFLGAVVSGNAELYQCNIRRALLRMKFVASVYDKKLELLYADRNFHCAVNPDECCDTFLATEFKDLAGDDIIPKSGLLEISQVGEFMSRQNSLTGRNNNAMRGSCPTLY